jgi:hypothetical protein
VEHVVMGCPFAKDLWSAIGFSTPILSCGRMSDIHNICCPANLPQNHLNTFVALCCWQLWKRRNGVIFGSQTTSLHQTFSACISDANLWQLRLPRKDRNLADVWVGVFRAATAM